MDFPGDTVGKTSSANVMDMVRWLVGKIPYAMEQLSHN